MTVDMPNMPSREIGATPRKRLHGNANKISSMAPSPGIAVLSLSRTTAKNTLSVISAIREREDRTDECA